MISHPIVRIGLLLRRLKAIESRTKAQKIVHILQAMGAPFPESFDFQYRGTHSDDLACELGVFRSEELVVESEVADRVPNLRATRKLLDLLEQDPSHTDEPEWLAWAEELNAESLRRLDEISTLLYFHQRRWPRAVWQRKFCELKPLLGGEFEPSLAKALELLAQAGKLVPATRHASAIA